jgi:hypothetical protein
MKEWLYKLPEVVCTSDVLINVLSCKLFTIISYVIYTLISFWFIL